MNRLPKLLILGAIVFGVSNYLTNKYLAPIEKRVEAMAQAAESIDTTTPPDPEKVCGKFDENLTPEQLEKISACYSRETQKQIDQLNKVLKAGDLPQLGSKEPCGPDVFEMIGDDGVGGKFINALFAKKPAEAHTLLSASFRGQVSEADLTNYVDKLLWRGKTIVGAKGLSNMSGGGDYRCEGKTMIPVTRMELILNDEVGAKAEIETVKEDGATKIRAIKVVHGSGIKDVKDAPLPDAKRLSELVAGAMQAFVIDMSGSEVDQVYHNASFYLRENTSRASLNEKYKPYFGKFPFGGMDGKTATLTSTPSVKMEDGWPVFEVKGTQPTAADTVNFKIKFAFDGSWRPAGIDVTTTPR